MITTHVLDLQKGAPASGVSVTLEAAREGGWASVGSGATDSDGRLRTLVPAGTLLPEGTYRLTFATASYFAREATPTFYPEVVVTFVVKEGGHYHVPLLLSPFGYSTYRGS